jgi:hypothetical protein
MPGETNARTTRPVFPNLRSARSRGINESFETPQKEKNTNFPPNIAEIFARQFGSIGVMFVRHVCSVFCFSYVDRGSSGYESLF